MVGGAEVGSSVIAHRSIREREAAITALESVLQDARQGRGETLFLVGEAGLGKTTMLQQARVRAGGGFGIGAGHGDAVEATLPFGIFSQALDDIGSRGILDVETAPAGFGVDARAARFYTVLRLLERGSGQPILLLLDDLHWADPDSLALISFLSRRIRSLPVAIIGTLRPWPPNAHDTAQRLAGAGDAGIVKLEPLTEAAAMALLEERVGTTLGEEHARLAPSLTGGNPLLVEQLAVVIARGSDIGHRDDATGVATEDLLVARFAGGTPHELRYAEAAAILGTGFRAELAAELAGLSRSEADRALEGLSASGVLRATAVGSAEFAHPLLRQALYDRMSPLVRSRRHAVAFRLLRQHGADAAEAGEHAIHADLVGDADAVAALERAGFQAQEAGALVTARQRFEAAVRLAGTTASATLRLALADVMLATGNAEAAEKVCRQLLARDDLTELQRIAVHRQLGRALFTRGDPVAAQEQFAVAVGRSARPTSETIETLLEAVYVAWPSGGPAMATPLAARARALAVDAAADLRLRTETAWAFSAFVGGDPNGVPIIEQAARRAEADPRSDVGTFAWTWGSIGLHGNVAKWTERFDEAERAFKVGMATAEQLNLPVAIASLAVMHGDTCARTGRLQDGLHWLDRASGLAELAPERAFWAAVAHSYILIEMGRIEEARSWADTARGLSEPVESWPGWIWMWHVDAQLAHLARRLDEECRLYERIETLADQAMIREPCVVPWMGDALAAYAMAQRYEDAARILSRLEAVVPNLPCRIPQVVVALAHARGFELTQQPEKAQQAYEEAVALSRQVAAPPLQARALLRYGTWLKRRGDLIEARRPFADALELADSSGAEPLATRAAEELAAVGGRRRRQRYQDPDALSPAEERVASLAAELWTDREIADRLNLSINTVETHLQHIYRKLDISSRRELMRRLRG